MRRACVWRIVILTLNGEGPNSATIVSTTLVRRSGKTSAGSTSGIHPGSPRGLDESAMRGLDSCSRMKR